jgi:hypothetical protein
VLEEDDDDGDREPVAVQEAPRAASADPGPDGARREAAGRSGGWAAGYGEGHDRVWRDRGGGRRQAAAAGTGGRRSGVTTDLTISIRETGDTVGGIGNSRRRREGPGEARLNHREQIERDAGTLAVETSRAGTVEVCVQSMVASQNEPRLVQFSVREDPEARGERAREAAERAHVNGLEGSVRSLMRRLELAQATARNAKEEEAQFRQKSVELDRAALVWPIVRCCFLILTGIGMARHVTGFLKQHRIY